MATVRHDRSRLPFFAALLLAGLTTAITIRHATFVPWGTDAAGYVGAARRWADSDLFKPAPLELWAPWSVVGPLSMDAPLAYRRGPERGTDEASIHSAFRCSWRPRTKWIAYADRDGARDRQRAPIDVLK